jgi:hypothetical protein
MSFIYGLVFLLIFFEKKKEKKEERKKEKNPYFCILSVACIAIKSSCNCPECEKVLKIA